jgi:hypothetical protein
LIKYAKVEEILEVKTSKEKLPYNPEFNPGDTLNKFASMKSIQDEDGYLYVRCRAISSRVNKNHDGWPSAQLAEAYESFIGRPIFVDHNNDDPGRTRGVIVDSRLHVDDEKMSSFDPYYANAPDNHKPPTWIELLLEVDAKTYPKLAKNVREGHIDSVSMGANIDLSICSVCSHEAKSPAEYCSHISKKGAEFEVTSSDGQKTMKKSYEDCHGINFFEISFVFDPADPTALISEKSDKKLSKEAGMVDDLGLNEDIEWEEEIPPTPELIQTPIDKHKDVEGWRLQQFLNLGLTPEQANSLVNRRTLEGTLIDHHDIQRLIDQGASPEVAVQILSKTADFADEELGLADETEQDMGIGPEKILEARRWLAECVDADIFSDIDPGSADDLLNPELYSDNEIMKAVSQHFDGGLQSFLQTFSKTAAPNLAGPDHAGIERNINFEPQSELPSSPEDVDTLRKEFPCPNCRADSLSSDPNGLMKCPTCSYVQPPHPMDNPDLSAHQRIDAQEDQDNMGMKTQQGIGGRRDEDLSGIVISPIQMSSSNNPIKNNNSVGVINRMNWTMIHNAATVETVVGNSKGITAETYKLLQDQHISAKITYPNGDSVNIPFDNPVVNMVALVKSKKQAGLSNIAEVPIKVESSLKDIETVVDIIHTGSILPRKKVLNPSVATKTDDPANAKIISDQKEPVTSTEKKVEPMEKNEVIKEAENTEAKLLVAFSLADQFAEMGLVNAENKLAFVADLEKETPEALEARKATLELVKKAGYSKPISRVAGLNRVPKISSFNKETKEVSLDDIPFESIFAS